MKAAKLRMGKSAQRTKLRKIKSLCMTHCQAQKNQREKRKTIFRGGQCVPHGVVTSPSTEGDVVTLASVDAKVLLGIRGCLKPSRTFSSGTLFRKSLLASPFSTSSYPVHLAQNRS